MLGTNYKYLQCEELTEPGLSPRLSQTGKLRELRGKYPFPPLPFGGCLSNDRFPWKKWDFVLKLKSSFD